MSDPSALAAVTATLKRLLDSKLRAPEGIGAGAAEAGEVIGGKQLRVTTDPPSKFAAIDPGIDEVRLNLFLYHVEPNAAWRNQLPPGRGKVGSGAPIPLALDASYLLSAFSTGDEAEHEAQQLLGRGLLILHDTAILGIDSIRLNPGDPALDFYGERVRIVPHAMSVDEMYKLWSTFQAPYRLSAAFHVSVILIDSVRPPKPAPPVLSRGETNPETKKDHGVTAEPGLEATYPQIVAVELADPAANPTRPPGLPVFEPGEVIRLRGGRLRFGNRPVGVFLQPASGGDPIELGAPAPSSTADRVDVALQALNAPNPPLRAGLFAVYAQVATDDLNNSERVTNELPLLLAPRIDTLLPPAVNGVRLVAANATLTLTVAPAVLPGQRVGLLVGDTLILPSAVGDAGARLMFSLASSGVVSGRTYPIRLRVDGVESFPVKPDRPYEFAYTVTIQ